MTFGSWDWGFPRGDLVGTREKPRPLQRAVSRSGSAESRVPTRSPRGSPKSRRRIQRRQTGFTLLEVIAALLLLAIAFTALMQVAGGATRLTQKAAQRSEAAMWARSLLDSAFVLEPITLGKRSGRFDARYGWQMNVTRWNRSGQPQINTPLQMYRIDLNVTWGLPARPNVAHFSTLRLVSAQANPGGGL